MPAVDRHTLWTGTWTDRYGLRHAVRLWSNEDPHGIWRTKCDAAWRILSFGVEIGRDDPMCLECLTHPLL